MSLVIIRPTAQHAASNVVTATQQDGLTVQEPAADATLGHLRLRCSGVPTAAEVIDVALVGGGAPTGYAIEADGGSSGASVRWKRATDGSTDWRGGVDTPALVRVAHPVAFDATHGEPSSVKVLPDGYLGFVMATVPSTETVRFYRVSPSWVASSVTIDTSAASGIRHDFAVLPSGRLIAVINLYYVYYSDDYGLTWSSLSTTNLNGASLDLTLMESVGDTLMLVSASRTGAVVANIAVSLDGGATWTATATAVAMVNPRSAALDGVLYLLEPSGISAYGRRIAPGGGLSDPVVTNLARNTTTLANCAIALRDDGTLWAMGWQATAVGALNMDMAASVDGGVTWTNTGAGPFTLVETGYTADGLTALSATAWQGMIVMLARTDSEVAGTDDGLHFLCFGEWSTYDEPASGLLAGGVFYRYGYIPVDLPNNLTWTPNTTGAGATMTFTPALRMVSTPGNGTRYVAPVGIWNPAAADHKMVKLRVKVNSGGSLTSNDICLQITINDGVNQQGVTLRLTTTGARLLNSNVTQIGSDLTATLTAWTEFIIDFWHDAPAGSGVVTVVYIQDGSSGKHTTWINAQTVTEQAGVATAALQWRAQNAADVELSMLLVGDLAQVSHDTNPADLVGRPMSASYDVFLASGIHLGAYGTGGIPGDAYDLTTRYTYGASKVWEELRPSCRAQSVDDSAAWGLELDRGPLDFFRGDTIAVFGTNVRTARWQLATSNIWAVVDVDVALDATLEAFTSTAAGLGSIRFANRNWRPGQWKSNGDSRRFFITYGAAPGVTYEITDNDEDRIYVTGVDLSAASGVTVYIFGDRMAARLPQFVEYRYARFYVSAAFTTADQVYRVGTPIFDRGWTPEQLYDFGFVERVEPNVATTDADSGASFSYRRGPVLDTLSIQWPPLDRLRVDVEERLRDLYRAINGSLTPIVLWRDTADLRTLSMVQVREVYQATNVRGELGTALTRVDQLVLREVW